MQRPSINQSLAHSLVKHVVTPKSEPLCKAILLTMAVYLAFIAVHYHHMQSLTVSIQKLVSFSKNVSFSEAGF